MALTLVTIGPSHYCEKARWALDRVGARYTEERHAPLFHRIATVRRGGKTTPILVTPHGVLSDSTDILRHLDNRLDEPARLYPHESILRAEVEGLEDELDETLGPAIRRWFYTFVTGEPDVLADCFTDGIGRVEALGMRAARVPIARLLRRVFRADDAARVKTWDVVNRVFDQLEARLADGRPYLTGDRFTAADLTAAALVGGVVRAPEHPLRSPAAERLGNDYVVAAKALRERPAGQFALRMYRDHRTARVG
jgi:glutathione S-transferase